MKNSTANIVINEKKWKFFFSKISYELTFSISGQHNTRSAIENNQTTRRHSMYENWKQRSKIISICR